jgi:Mor family transcriptional regulator
MGKAPEEKKQRNLEFYKRWQIDGENIYDLIKEYGFSYPRAYQLKVNLEKKYPNEINKLRAN